MSALVKRHANWIRTIASGLLNENQLKQIIPLLTKTQLKVIVECAYNLLRGTLHLSIADKHNLQRFASNLRVLGNLKATAKSKRAAINHKLLKALFSLVTPVL